ncbi:MAG: type II secretion system F family protein [Anaerovoracaceae bacterium]
MKERDFRVYRLSKKERNIFLIAGYAIFFTLAYIFYHSIIISAVVGLLIFLFIKKYEAYKREKRRQLLVLQFKDLLYSLATSFATGRQMPEALMEGRKALLMIYAEDSPLITELTHMVKALFEGREKEDKILLDFASRSSSEDISSFVEVYLTCRVTGGNVEKVVANATEILADKISIEKEIKTMTSQKEFEGKIISTMPILIIIFLNFFSPDYLEIMYTSFTGRIMMTVALLGIGAAYYLTEKLTKISV